MAASAVVDLEAYKGPSTKNSMVVKVPAGTQLSNCQLVAGDDTSKEFVKCSFYVYNPSSGDTRYDDLYIPYNPDFITGINGSSLFISTSSTNANDPIINSATGATFTPITYDGAYFKESGGMDNKYAQMIRDALGSSTATKATMQLFGLPYQFMDTVDSRLDGVSNIMGTQYLKNIVAEAPILYITPGKAKYLGNYAADSETVMGAFLQEAGSMFSNMVDGIQAAKDKIKGTDQLRYYDFEQDYAYYMQYVNMMCRTAAGFLGISSKTIQPGGKALGSFDWKNYRFDGGNYTSMTATTAKAVKEQIDEMWDTATTATKEALNKVGEAVTDLMNYMSNSNTNVNVRDINQSLVDSNNNSTAVAGSSPKGMISLESGEDSAGFIDKLSSTLSTNHNYVQFYIEPTSFSETISNQTQQSTLASMVTDKAGAAFKEFQFLFGTGGAESAMENIQSFASESASSFVSAMQNLGGSTFQTVLGRIATIGGHIITGDTMIFPEIFMKSEYSRNYNITIILKSPYGDKFSYYMNIIVPLCHLIALAAPKQSTANTYSTPFLVKAFLPGVFNINMGIVKSLTLEKNPEGDGLSVDGYPLEIKVTLNIDDLYADMMIAPTSDPLLFSGNTSLIEFLATNCGLDITIPNYESKYSLLWNNIKNSFTNDLIQNIGDQATSTIDNKITDNMLVNLLREYG